MSKRSDKISKQKWKELDEAQKKIDAANLALKKKEDDFSSRTKDLALREQETDLLKNSIEAKEQELLAKLLNIVSDLTITISFALGFKLKNYSTSELILCYVFASVSVFFSKDNDIGT